MGRFCEACTGRKRKYASYGLKDTRKKRWCGPCAKKQRGATERIGGQKMCEDCKEKQPHCGLEADRKPR